jgi:hypothetical protein
MTRRQFLFTPDLTAQTGRRSFHYIFFNRDRERILDPAFQATAAIAGAQIKYTWRELEPEPGHYRFEPIERDLTVLAKSSRRLFAQIQDVSFHRGIVNTPASLSGAAYRGGIARQYTESGRRKTAEGWVARRWDLAVQDRFHRLLAALGSRFNDRVEGITLPETAIEVDPGRNGALPAGFSTRGYRDAIVATLAAAKRGFPGSVVLQYVNFMPAEWLPGDDKGYLRSVYEAAHRLGAGVGGPDLLPCRKGHLNRAYPLNRQSAGIVPTGIAVQDGNFEHVNPATGRRVDVAGLDAFASGHLRVRCIFWGTQEPYCSRELLPLLRRQQR